MKVVDVAGRLNRAEDRHGAEAATQRDNLAKVEERVNNVQVIIREIHEKINKVILRFYHGTYRSSWDTWTTWLIGTASLAFFFRFIWNVSVRIVAGIIADCGGWICEQGERGPEQARGGPQQHN